jgi:hypothetical protein
VRKAFVDPLPDDVAWLAAQLADNDQDHALWELRYARRALVYHAARRDSLDDKTPAAVARVLEAMLEADTSVAADMKEVAQQQFNVRLRAYGLAIDEHDARSLTERMGQLLLSFAGARQRDAEQVRQAGGMLVLMLREANANLRQTFGAASLPEAGSQPLPSGTAQS